MVSFVPVILISEVYILKKLLETKIIGPTVHSGGISDNNSFSNYLSTIY